MNLVQKCTVQQQVSLQHCIIQRARLRKYSSVNLVQGGLVQLNLVQNGIVQSSADLSKKCKGQEVFTSVSLKKLSRYVCVTVTFRVK